MVITHHNRHTMIMRYLQEFFTQALLLRLGTIDLHAPTTIVITTLIITVTRLQINTVLGLFQLPYLHGNPTVWQPNSCLTLPWGFGWPSQPTCQPRHSYGGKFQQQKKQYRPHPCTGLLGSALQAQLPPFVVAHTNFASASSSPSHSGVAPQKWFPTVSSHQATYLNQDFSIMPPIHTIPQRCIIENIQITPKTHT